MSLELAKGALSVIQEKIKQPEEGINQFREDLAQAFDYFSDPKRSMLLQMNQFKYYTAKIGQIEKDLKKAIESDSLTEDRSWRYVAFATKLSMLDATNKTPYQILKDLEELASYDLNNPLPKKLVDIKEEPIAVVEEPLPIPVPSYNPRPKSQRFPHSPMAKRLTATVALLLLSTAGVLSLAEASQAQQISSPAVPAVKPTNPPLFNPRVISLASEPSAPSKPEEPVVIPLVQSSAIQKPATPAVEKPKTELTFPQLEVIGMPQGVLKVGQKVNLQVNFPKKIGNVRYFVKTDLTNSGKWDDAGTATVEGVLLSFIAALNKPFNAQGDQKISIALFAEVDGKVISGPEKLIIYRVENPVELQIAQKAKEIASQLSKGGDGYLNKYAAEPGVYFWCTDMVIRSYNSAGIMGLTRASHLAVVNMRTFFEQTPGFLYTPVNQKAIENLKPGDAIFFGPDHVGLAGNINIVNGNGTIQLIHSNGATAIDTIEVRNYKLSQPKNLLMSVTGFGQRTR